MSEQLDSNWGKPLNIRFGSILFPPNRGTNTVLWAAHPSNLTYNTNLCIGGRILHLQTSHCAICTWRKWKANTAHFLLISYSSSKPKEIRKNETSGLPRTQMNRSFHVDQTCSRGSKNIVIQPYNNNTDRKEHHQILKAANRSPWT